MVYKWGFLYLNYLLEVSISRIYLLSSYNWFYRFCISHHLMPYSCSDAYAQDTVFNTCFWFEFIDTHVLVPAATWHLSCHLLRSFLTPLDLHVQISELGAYGFSWLLIREAQRKRGSSADHPESFFSRSLDRLSSFPLVTRERLFVLFIIISLCNLIFTPIGDVIFL